VRRHRPACLDPRRRSWPHVVGVGATPRRPLRSPPQPRRCPLPRRWHRRPEPSNSGSPQQTPRRPRPCPAGRPVTPDRRSQTTRVPRGMIGTATRVPCPWPATPAAPIRGSPPRLPAAPPDAGDRRAGRGAAAVRRRGGRLVTTEVALAPITAAAVLGMHRLFADGSYRGAAPAGGGGRACRDRGAAPARRAPPAGRRRTQPRRWDSSWCTARWARRKGRPGRQRIAAGAAGRFSAPVRRRAPPRSSPVRSPAQPPGADADPVLDRRDASKDDPTRVVVSPMADIQTRLLDQADVEQGSAAPARTSRPGRSRWSRARR
jgi:hypothetical protein